MSEETQSEALETTEAPEPRLLRHYREEVVPRLMERLGLENSLAAPAVSKIVLNMGIGEAKTERKVVTEAQTVLSTITGQKPVITRARKSVAGFALRQGTPVGCKVTLRRRRMYEFLDRLISIALPRIRDFRGLSTDSFDGHGNYTLGIQEHFVFPEMDPDAVENIYGMDVTICTTARSDPEALELLRLLGMPLQQ